MGGCCGIVEGTPEIVQADGTLVFNKHSGEVAGRDSVFAVGLAGRVLLLV